MQKLIFLDFDGVLNSHAGWSGRPLPTKNFTKAQLEDRDICSDNIQQLNRLVSETGAQVVVSSTWRLRRTVEQLRDILRRNGFTGEVIGSTPELLPRRPRGMEIQAWLDTHAEKEVTFVILDDDSDMQHLIGRLVRTSMFSGGLTAQHVADAIQLLYTV